MADQRRGGISWTDETWNPIRGCSRVNADCIHCYAERMAAGRLSGPGRPYEGLAKMTSAGPRWTGRVILDEKTLRMPLQWRRPRLVFVNSMSDPFVDVLPFELVDRIVAVMALTPKHTYQVLTKRPKRMAEYLNGPSRRVGVLKAAREFDAGNPAIGSTWWPLRNVWWGASMGHQAAADEFVPALIEARGQARVLWISAEPLWEEVDLFRTLTRRPDTPWLDWVVGGGESGPQARTCPIAAARRLRDDCISNHVPFHWKQWGSRPPAEGYEVGRALDGRVWDEWPKGFSR